MKIVGDKLAEIADSEQDSTGRDLFGRSAFNRYYYSIYLITIGMLENFESEDKNINHSSIPDMLKGRVRNRSVDEIDKAVRNKMINYAVSRKLKRELIRGLNELANLMNEAYGIRVIADYRPKQPLESGVSGLKLGSCTLSSAKGWEGRANLYCGRIISVWRTIGYV